MRTGISEDMRNDLWREYGVAFDAHLNIVWRKDHHYRGVECWRGADFECWRGADFMSTSFLPEGTVFLPMMLCGPHASDMLSDYWNDPLWELQWPIEQYLWILGDAVCVAPKAPLGRAFTMLTRRIRFRKKARATLVRLLPGDLPEVCAQQVASCFVTLYPRVA